MNTRSAVQICDLFLCLCFEDTSCIFTIQQIYEYLTNSQRDYVPVGLIAQLLEHCNGIAEVMGSIPVQA